MSDLDQIAERAIADLTRIYTLAHLQARDAWSADEAARMVEARDIAGNLIEQIQNAQAGR